MGHEVHYIYVRSTRSQQRLQQPGIDEITKMTAETVSTTTTKISINTRIKNSYYLPVDFACSNSA